MLLNIKIDIPELSVHHIVELQIHHTQILEAKGAAHAVYEYFRSYTHVQKKIVKIDKGFYVQGPRIL